jgi:hypothetical protein
VKEGDFVKLRDETVSTKVCKDYGIGIVLKRRTLMLRVFFPKVNKTISHYYTSDYVCLR